LLERLRLPLGNIEGTLGLCILGGCEKLQQVSKTQGDQAALYGHRQMRFGMGGDGGRKKNPFFSSVARFINTTSCLFRKYLPLDLSSTIGIGP